MIRFAACAAGIFVLALGSAASPAWAQAGAANQGNGVSPGTPAAKAPPPAPRPAEWWCEINAQPNGTSSMSKDDAAKDFFVSQVVSRPRHLGAGAAAEEIHTVERMCRTSFEVQFGSDWTLVTARAQQAATRDIAVAEREQDMQLGLHMGHTRTFRIPE